MLCLQITYGGNNMKYCDQCGAKLNDSSKFCFRCGERFAGFCQIEKAESASPKIDVQSVQIYPYTYEESFNGIDIREYLQCCINLEQNIYVQENTIIKLKSRRDSIGHPKSFKKPTKPEKVTISDGDEGAFFSIAGTGAFIGAVLGLFWGEMFWGALIGAILLVIAIYTSQAISNKKYNDAMESAYFEELHKYQKAKATDDNRVEQETEEKINLYGIIDSMEDDLVALKTTRKNLYDIGILDKKYRDLVPVCSLYEYFDVRKYTSLAGPGGAYDRYEMELRLDHIIAKLDEVICRLDEIKSSQYMLYTVINEGNQLTEKLVQQSVIQSQLAETTAKNTALAAQQAKIAANNSEAVALIELATYMEIRKDINK